MRNVTVQRVAATETVLATGVQPGDTVVTDGHLRLVPGSRISVKGDANQQASQPQEDRKSAP
jgi:multidrug efflux system membrane fusion protein